MIPVRLILSALLAVLKIGNAVMKAIGDEKLREAGRLKEVARASLDLLATVEQAHEVDRAILDADADDKWVQRVRDEATAPDK